MSEDRSETGAGPSKQQAEDPWNRDGSGRFGKGNQGGPGASALAVKQTKLRIAMLAALQEEDVQEVVRKLIELAKEGSIAAAKEVLDRAAGKAEAYDLAVRLEQVEKLLARLDRDAPAPNGRLH
jgi:hypothetical protein